jgi:hypothetical protein
MMTPINVSRPNRTGNPHLNQEQALCFHTILGRSQRLNDCAAPREPIPCASPHLPRSGRSGRKSTVRKPSPAMTAPTVKALASPAR